jgi:TolB-like protein/DNA-binding winged helix-turn-helix (wHTH) protein
MNARSKESMAAPVYEFDDFRLDCGRFELLRGVRSLKLERKPMELLILLVSREGQLVTRTEISERLWGQEVFVDTEHGINTAIRKIRTVLNDDPENPRFLQTVTGMGYRFIAPITATGVSAAQPPAPTPAEPPIPVAAAAIEPAAPARRALWLALTAAAVVLILTLAATLGPHPLAARILHRKTPHAITSIAVLPLDNLSGDPNQNYFADGMTDELTTMLAKNSTLRIVSRTSVMQYRDAHRPLPSIARELNVDGILEGSVSRSGDQVHMTLQLIRADTDAHLWAESYDRSANDASTLPTEAAQAIAAHLSSAVPTPAAIRYVNPEAHDAYLHGRYLWYADQNEKAGDYFKKATEIQPDYAPGWSGLSMYYGAGAVDGLLDPRQSLAPAEEAAMRAVQLDDTFAEAHLSLCAALLLNRWDFAGSDAECKHAVQLDPHFAEAYHFRAKILAALNRHSEAIELQKKAQEIDPFSRPFALAYSYQLAGQYDAALTDARQRLETGRDDASLHWILSETYRCKGMYKEAVEERAKMLSLRGDQATASALRHAWQQGGYQAALRWQIADLQKQAKSRYVAPYNLALLYAQLNDREKALAFLDQSFQHHSPDLLWIKSEPAFNFIHSDPRYRSIIKRIGIPPTF